MRSNILTGNNRSRARGNLAGLTTSFEVVLFGSSRVGIQVNAQQQLCHLCRCRCRAYCKQGWPIIEALLADPGKVAICSNQHLCTDRWVPPVKVDGDSILVLIVLCHLQHGRHRLLKTSLRYQECTSSCCTHHLIAMWRSVFCTQGVRTMVTHLPLCHMLMRTHIYVYGM